MMRAAWLTCERLVAEAARQYALPEAVAARVKAAARQKAKHTGSYVRHMHQIEWVAVQCVVCKLMWVVVVG